MWKKEKSEKKVRQYPREYQSETNRGKNCALHRDIGKGAWLCNN
jgi:hypothetical protein